MTQFTRVPLRRDRKNRRPALPGWLLGVLVGGVLLGTFFSAYLVFNTVRNVVSGWKITGQDVATPIVAAGTQPAVSTAGGTPGPVATLAPNSTPVPTVDVEAWTSTERVMILVMGIDRRVGEDERGYRTDTLLLVGIDPATRTAAMLSIPRDLWVTIPGFDENTINTANWLGDLYNYPGGGPALAVKTVEYNLGVTINYYVRLDFTAFETMIDAVGGVEIVNQTAIEDDEYPNGSYGYEPFYLDEGPHHLDGHDALRYARTRHNSTDIDRAHRQQEVVLAVRDRVLNLNQLPGLIAQAPHLYQTLNDSIQTNLTLDQMVSLALLAQDIPRENIKSGVIDYSMVSEGTTADGKEVLRPLRDKIRALRDELFTNAGGVTAPTDPAEELALMAAEGAKVEVLNGAGVEGLACDTRDWLVAQGLQALDCATADRTDYTSSVIVAYSGKPYTIGWLKRMFGVTTIISADPDSAYDIKVIVGTDWRIPTDTP